MVSYVTTSFTSFIIFSSSTSASADVSRRRIVLYRTVHIIPCRIVLGEFDACLEDPWKAAGGLLPGVSDDDRLTAVAISDKTVETFNAKRFMV
jgi:hypothetical protein